MTIQTKYSTGDTVFVIHNNKLREAIVREITATARRNQETKIKYLVWLSPNSPNIESASFLEKDVYPTSEQAKASV